MVCAAFAAHGGRSHNSCEHFSLQGKSPTRCSSWSLPFTTGKTRAWSGKRKDDTEKTARSPAAFVYQHRGEALYRINLAVTGCSRKRLDLAASRQPSVSGYCCGADNRARRRSPRRVCFQRQCFSCLGTTTSAIRCRCSAHVSTGSRHARYVGGCLVKRRRQQCNTASAPACARRCRQELGAHRRAEKEASGSQTGGEEEVALSSCSTVQSAFNWAHSGVRSPATRRAGGSGARGSGVGSSTALALLLSDDAVRVSPLSTRPERRRGEERDGTSALEIVGACARGQAGAYQSGSRRSLRRLRGSAAAGMNDGRCRGDDARDTGRAKHRIESHGSVSTFAYSFARTPTAASTVHAKPQKLHS